MNNTNKVRHLIAKQRAFGINAFGKHTITTGIHAHLLKELDEVRANPEDKTEWADCFILILDGAHRACDSSHIANQHLQEQLKQTKGKHRVTSIDEFEKIVRDATEGDLKNAHTWAVFARYFLNVLDAVGNMRPRELFDVVDEKQSVNMARKWGDVKDQDPSKPIEHKRTAEEVERKEKELRAKEAAPAPDAVEEPKPKKAAAKKAPAKKRAPRKTAAKK